MADAKVTKRSRKRRFTAVAGVLLVVAAMAGYMSMAFSFLSPTRPVSANILVVEGWLPDDALYQAASEFHRGTYDVMLITGFPFDKGVLLGVEGSLVFRLYAGMPQPDDTVSVTLDGTKGCGAYAHFKILADSQVLGDAWSTRRLKTYHFPLHTAYSPHSISVVFDNDCVEGGNDRNLRVKSISYGRVLLMANDTSVTFHYKDIDGYGSIKKMASGSSAAAAEVLKNMVGRDSLVVLETNWKTRSKTYTSAIDVRRWIEAHVPGKVSVNVLTMGVHARRTWTSYRRVFGTSSPVGIISLPDPSLSSGSWRKSLAGWKKVVRETFGQLYIFITG